ncbi:hypothetical protein CPB86DRAFT_802611, partial [Serendipita vermifera]
MESTSPIKRKQPTNQDQYPNKSRKLEPKLVQDVVMASGETDFSLLPSSHPRRLIRLHRQAPKWKTLEGAVQDFDFDGLVGFIRGRLKKHTDLVSKLGIVLTNLESGSPEYKEIENSTTLMGALFDTISNVIENPGVKTWKAVFSHQLFRRKSIVDKLTNPQYQAQMEATHKGWQAEYIGSSHILLWEHLKKASSTLEKEAVYAFCSSIVQSSGMGKSRLVTKMSEDHVAGYPPPDKEARDFLITKTHDTIDYNMRVQAFLMALLQTAHSTLKKQYGDMPVAGKEKTIAGSEMSHGDARNQFYKTVVGQAEKIYGGGRQRKVLEAQVEGVTSPMKSMMMLPSSDETETNSQPRSQEDLPQIATNLLDYLSKLVGESREGPLLTLSWDEAHVLTNQGFEISKDPLEWTQFNEFRRVLRTCDRSGRLFSLFLSTTGKIDQFSPDLRDDPSTRIGDQKLKLPLPFINLGFDIFARHVIPTNGFKLSEAIETRQIVKFGRPLWHTRYTNGDEEVKKSILDFAMVKLLCRQETEGQLSTQDILAVMGFRLGLRQNAQNRSEADVAKRLVERHMHVVMRMTADLSTIMTLAPSEPILAEASIKLMRKWKKAGMLGPAEALHQVLGNSLHAKGERGEFIAALLLLLARDEAQEEEKSAKIPVTTFLKRLLGRKVPGFSPSFYTPETKTTRLEDAFQNGYIHFTHTVVLQKQNNLSMEYLWPLLARGALPICATNQRGVDIMIPVVLGDMVNETTVTAIFIQ